MLIYELNGVTPRLPSEAECFIADTAQLIGDVRIGRQASVWFNAVLRADNAPIELGDGSNIQDNCTCHADEDYPLVIGRNCTIGHGVILHGCSIDDDVLVGMGSIIMNGARISRGCVIGAGSVVTEGQRYEEFSLILGTPARFVRTMTTVQSSKMMQAAVRYHRNSERFRTELIRKVRGVSS